jgi:hypothetical protein
MKTIALLALWSFFFGFVSHEPEPTIMGDWLLQESSTSGCFTSTTVVYKPAEQKIIHFSPPNRYILTSRDTTVASGTFELTPQENLEMLTTGLTLTLTVDQSIEPKLMASTSTVYELTDARLVIGNTIANFKSRSVYTRIL